ASTPIRFSMESRPCSWMTCAIVNTLETDWIDTSVEVTGGVHLPVSGDQNNAEKARIHLRQRGNVDGVLAFLQVLEFRVGRGDGRLWGGLRPNRQRRHGDCGINGGQPAAETFHPCHDYPPTFAEKLYLNENC